MGNNQQGYDFVLWSSGAKSCIFVGVSVSVGVFVGVRLGVATWFAGRVLVNNEGGAAVLLLCEGCFVHKGVVRSHGVGGLGVGGLGVGATSIARSKVVATNNVAEPLTHRNTQGCQVGRQGKSIVGANPSHGYVEGIANAEEGCHGDT